MPKLGLAGKMIWFHTVFTQLKVMLEGGSPRNERSEMERALSFAEAGCLQLDAAPRGVTRLTVEYFQIVT